MIGVDGREEDAEDVLSDDDYVHWKGSDVEEEVKRDDIVHEVQSAFEVLAVVDQIMRLSEHARLGMDQIAAERHDGSIRNDKHDCPRNRKRNLDKRIDLLSLSEGLSDGRYAMMKQKWKYQIREDIPKEGHIEECVAPWWCEVHLKSILEDDDNGS